METTFSAVALIISIVSAVWTVVIHHNETARQRRQATLDAFNILQNEVFDRINEYSKEDIESVSLDPKSKDYKQVTVLLARWEHFCVGVNSRIYDIETVRRLAGRYLIQLYDKLEPLVNRKRELNKSEKHYDEVEKMIKRLRDLYAHRYSQRLI